MLTLRSRRFSLALIVAPLVSLACGSAAFAQDVNAVAKERLEKSPRHLEWVTVKNGDREVKSFVAFPEVAEKATAVIVIHEIFGLTDWVRGVTDQLAEKGYIAIAPDLLSGAGPNGGGTESLQGGDGVRGVIGNLPPDQITADLKAAVEYAKSLPACNGKVVVCGFCWGGRQTFRFATDAGEEIEAAFVFYGDAPTEAAEFDKIEVPVYGFYGGSDARINAGIPKAEEQTKAAGVKYEPVIYDGAGHGFMRAGEAPDASEANAAARKAAWDRWAKILKAI
ncbi:MAG TPA: dienelactone hydrolase family protein [Pirellulaceae bacterium]|jgi:carboxymethylenebutenolidase|nr:dienelactone hydrolase family protein [Pirellulaceae bacterium]